MAKKLLNATIFSIVATMLGREKLTDKDGKLDLSQAEEEKIIQTYGKTFLDNLKASSDTDEDAASIFTAMVDAAKQKDVLISQKDVQLEEKDGQIAQLQQSVNDLASQPEPSPVAAKPASAKAAAQFVVNAGAKHNMLAAQALTSGNPGHVMMVADESGIDVTDLNAELGTVMPAGTRIDVLTKRIYNGFDDAQYLTKVQSNTDYKAAAALMTEVSQQFTPAWTPKGTGKFTPCTIKYRRHKINVEILPAEILKSWLLYLYTQGKTQSEMPIVKYMIENHILPKVNDDITLAMLGKGKFVEVENAQDGDEGSAASASMDGYETILVEGMSDETCKMNFYKAAADFRTMTDEQVLAYIDGFVDNISPLFAQRLEIHCSPEFLTRYKRADFAVNGKYSGMESDGKIRFTNFTLIPLQSMYNSPIIFATPRENFVMLVDLAKADKCINKIAEENYKVKVFGEYSLSVGFRIQEAVYAAVPAGYNPQEAIASDATSINDAWATGGGGSSSSSSEEEGSSSSSEEGA